MGSGSPARGHWQSWVWEVGSWEGVVASSGLNM